ncbi:MAG: hypothetical protein LDLANPLL_00909 [Turneriella sp.]|nr:hypothetical protein [Turneriella sp.]
MNLCGNIAAVVCIFFTLIPSWGIDTINEPLIQDSEGKYLVTQEPLYIGFSFGMHFLSLESAQVSAAKEAANHYLLRQNSAIYTAPTSTLEGTGGGAMFVPSLRADLEIPFTRIPRFPRWKNFFAYTSLEIGWSSNQTLLSAEQNFRFLNNQASAVELTDVTYHGKISIDERKQYFAPMLGVGINGGKLWKIAFLARIAVGMYLQNGVRRYSLTTQEVNVVSTGNPAFSGNYHVSGNFVESYYNTPFFAARTEIGLRYAIYPKIYVSLLGGVNVLYGRLPFDTTGSFTEVFNGKKNFGEFATTTRDEEVFTITPSVFLALNYEL